MATILVIGACGKLGRELTAALREKYGRQEVLAADITALPDRVTVMQPYVNLNVLDKLELRTLILKRKVREVYHLAAMLTSAAEKQPLTAWELNMQGLLNVLEIAKSDQLKVFWPSSIAVFGPTGPRALCPQHTLTEPSTAYGISKVAGEQWCRYYHDQYGVDVRSIRYPGLIGTDRSGNGATSYAVNMFYDAVRFRQHSCFLKAHTVLPMLYMPEAVRAAITLMEVPQEKIKVRGGYNLQAMSFSPEQLAGEIRSRLPSFTVNYRPDQRQQIADTWPASVDDRQARQDWNWKPVFDLPAMVTDMLLQVSKDVE